MNNQESFDFTYSAAQRQEIETIRKKYLPKQEDKMEQLRKLHNSASQKAQSWAIALGIIGTLILGTGMSLAMTQLGESLGMSQLAAMLAGIPIGLVGILLVCLAYPVYNRRLTQERKMIAPQILKLTDELMK